MNGLSKIPKFSLSHFRMNLTWHNPKDFTWTRIEKYEKNKKWNLRASKSASTSTVDPNLMMQGSPEHGFTRTSRTLPEPMKRANNYWSILNNIWFICITIQSRQGNRKIHFVICSRHFHWKILTDYFFNSGFQTNYDENRLKR